LQGPFKPFEEIVPKDAAAILENCRALINQITAGLSVEKPFVNISSTAELLLHLESALTALRSSLCSTPQRAMNSLDEDRP
jgi:hypothetical protein